MTKQKQKSIFDSDEWKAAASARSEINQAVIRMVRETAGEEALSKELIWPNSAFTRDVPTPVDGLKAALLLQNAAAFAMREFIRAARAQGDSWKQIAVLLGYQDSDDYDGTPAEHAFELVAGPSRPFEHASTSWTCSSCNEKVTDHGPFESHPEDNESYHAGYDGKPGPQCARFKAEVAAWRRRNR